jgi:hypothetical protein
MCTEREEVESRRLRVEKVEEVERIERGEDRRMKAEA